MYKPKTCGLCGITFIPKSSKEKYCRKSVNKICSVCGKSFTTICHPKSDTTCENPECKRRAGYVASAKPIRRICRVCNEPFDATNGHQKDCNKIVTKECIVCGKPFNTYCRVQQSPVTCGDPDCTKLSGITVTQMHFQTTTKICVWCGEEFHPINNKQVQCNKPHTMICRICGKPYEVNAGCPIAEAPKFCSNECRSKGHISHKLTPSTIEKMKKTKIEKYGTDYGAKAFAKGRQTYLERTGYTHQIYNPDTHFKMAKSRENNVAKDGKLFDSQYECRFYNFIIDIPKLDIADQVPITYLYQNTMHTTWIDFKINNKLVEVKGGHLLAGVFDSIGIPMKTKLGVYNDNYVVIITNDNQNVRDILKAYENIIGIDILIFDENLTQSDKINRWDKIIQAIHHDAKFIGLSDIDN